MMNHNDFPKMTEEFDRSVRRALDSLPERESKPVRRFSAKKIVCAGLVAALCIGGTAFAANAQSWFPLLFPNGGDANLEGYVQTADNAKLTTRTSITVCRWSPCCLTKARVRVLSVCTLQTKSRTA